MTCGGISIGGCGMVNNFGSRIFCGETIPQTTSHKEKDKTSNFSTKRIFVYDINPDKNKVTCLQEITENNNITYSKKEIELNKLRKFAKKGDYNINELFGISIKKDGTFKLKPKKLKPYMDLLEEKIPNIKEHIKHMKDVKKQLKEEKESDFDYDER